jgi:hypothetical protein
MRARSVMWHFNTARIPRFPSLCYSIRQLSRIPQVIDRLGQQFKGADCQFLLSGTGRRTFSYAFPHVHGATSNSPSATTPPNQSTGQVTIASKLHARDMIRIRSPAALDNKSSASQTHATWDAPGDATASCARHTTNSPIKNTGSDVLKEVGSTLETPRAAAPPATTTPQMDTSFSAITLSMPTRVSGWPPTDTHFATLVTCMRLQRAQGINRTLITQLGLLRAHSTTPGEWYPGKMSKLIRAAEEAGYVRRIKVDQKSRTARWLELAPSRRQ